MRAVAALLALASMCAHAALAAAPQLAIVVQDQVALRGAARDAAPVQAVLTQGDTLEIRGQRMDYLQVYDYRRERAGFVRQSQVRTTRATPQEAPELLAVLRFVRDTPGSEALGVAYAAAYLQAAPAGSNTAEAQDALGQMADRLARRATSRQGSSAGAAPTAADTRLAAQLEAVAAYGIQMTSTERDGSMQICYDGDAFARVLAQPAASPEQRARATLALSRSDCQDPNLSPTVQTRQDQQRARLLEQIDTATLSPVLANRIQLRRAAVQSALAFAATRRQEAPQALAAAQRAVDALAALNRAELADADFAAESEAAIRVSASRWAAVPAAETNAAGSRPRIVTQPGEPGQTCVLLVDAQHPTARPLHQRCTYGVAWTASASTSPNGKAVALAVQPLAGWRELWLYRQTAEGWTLDTVPPGSNAPGLGTLEFAGWVHGGERLLALREAVVEGRAKRSFEVWKLDTLAVEKQASSPGLLVLFGKWQDPVWKQMTVALR
nr:hypothetical protein [uncultured Albidiferax sp.]